MASAGRGTVSREAERVMRTIFKRCVQCPDANPSCPSCGKNEICSLVPSDCFTCAHNVCVRNPNPAPSSSGPNVGAIAGGVVGGVAFVAIVVFLLWRFWIKKKRAQQEAEAEEWEEDDIAAQKSMHQFQAMQHDAASTRTRGSLANSILSRASNIIQIAYIPGVTNRNGSGHNSISGASPVPPIPAARRDMPRSPLANDDGALFFRPGDLRDSTWSGTSSLTGDGRNRDTTYTRASITPSLARSSIGSGIYRDNASVEPMPAQQVLRAAPRMVSVKSGSPGSPGETSGSGSTPTTGNAEFAANTPSAKGKTLQVMMPGQASSRPTTSTSSNSNPSFVKAQQITVGSGSRSNSRPRGPSRAPSDSSTATATTARHVPNVSSPLAGLDTADEDSDSEDEHARARRSLAAAASTTMSPSAQPLESPFFDASETPPASGHSTPNRPNPYASMAKSVSAEDRPRRGANPNRGPGGLSAVIEEATRRASRVPSHEGLGGRGDREGSPFGDEFESGR